MIYPAAFAKYRQFILHRAKVPINPHTFQPFGKGSDWQHDRTCWTDGTTATQLLQVLGPEYGLGFLFTADDPFFFVDIDKCLTDGKWSQVACDVLAMFPGCAVEVSTSGTGLHVFGSGSPSTDHACKNTALGLEFYTRERFVALTGTHAAGDAATVCSPDLFVERYMRRDVSPEAIGWTTEPVEGYTHLDDEELIRKACRSGGAGSVFGERATFGDLWHCNERILTKAYPSSTPGASYDGSSADAALAQHLAFWTGRNCERVMELMQQSALVRDKWQRADYLIRTIEGAVSRQVEVYKGPDKRREQQLAENAAIGEDVQEESRHTPILTLPEMLSQLVFIGGEHAVGHMPSKRLRRKAAAADEYAASMHTYVDPDTRAEKSTPAFKAWLSQRDRISVECATWHPGAPEICSPPEGHGLAFNTWRGLRAHSAPNDWMIRAQPFIDHVTWLCGPDTMPFLQWLAHIVQHPAQLPHTCYLHVTPTTGIGRNWVSGVLCRVLRGYVAVGVDIGKVLDGKFNGRLSQKLLAIVDEVREGGDYGKRASRGEKLKATITEEIRHIDPKYGVQTIEYNCCRWLMYSQHQDALPFESNDRRVIVINNPTVRKSPEYYSALYGRLHDEQFIASVWQYLLTLDLSEFNPCTPPVMSAAKQLALEAMASEADFAVDEFLRVWPGDVATLSQVKEFVGDVKDSHLRQCLIRAGRAILPTMIKLPSGVRSRVVVVRGPRTEAEVRNDLRDACIGAEVKFRMEGP